MSSPDSTPPWGTPQSPSGAANPAPPPMMSPYGMPLSDGGPEGSGGHGNQGGQGGYSGYGGYGPGDGDPGDSRRRKTLIASALAVVAVVGIGGAVAFMGGGSPHKPDTASLAGAGASESGSSPAGNGSAVSTTGGKPDGDDMAAASTNGAQGANLPGAPSSTGTPAGGHAGQSTNPGSPTTGHPATSTHPGSPTSSHPGAPAVSNPPPSAAKPSAPATTITVSVPSTDCTYMDLPASKMPQIKEGSTNVNAVKQVQCLLKKSELGIKPLAIDGQWGPDTQSAMTAFQSCNNAPTVHSPGGTPPYPKLAVDGEAGPQTWADLYFWDNQYFNGTSYYCNGTR